MQIEKFPRPEWVPKPNDNAKNIEVRVLADDARLCIAQLRFATHASFAAHDAPWDCQVLCLEGSGFVLVGEETAPISQGDIVFWPKLVKHQLWTEDSTMVTEMIEHRHEFADPMRAWREHHAR